MDDGFELDREHLPPGVSIGGRRRSAEMKAHVGRAESQLSPVTRVTPCLRFRPIVGPTGNRTW